MPRPYRKEFDYKPRRILSAQRLLNMQLPESEVRATQHLAPVTWNIAYTTDRRGLNDDIYCFLFRGAELNMISRVFTWLHSKGKGMFKDFRLYFEDDACCRHGKSNTYLVCEIEEPNFDFCPLNSIALLVESRMKAECKCNVTKMTLNKFLNC